MLKWLRSQDRNELTYWAGLIMLFVGLSNMLSIWMALSIMGGVMAGESVITSYLAIWISSKMEPRRK